MTGKVLGGHLYTGHDVGTGSSIATDSLHITKRKECVLVKVKIEKTAVQ